MFNRTYRLLFGIALLLSLYFDSRTGLYSLIALALFEAISNLRVPRVIRRLRHQEDCDPKCAAPGVGSTFSEAELGWRLLVATFLTISIVVVPETLWFVPWFMGFAIMGAGISGVCPVFLALKWAGLR